MSRAQHVEMTLGHIGQDARCDRLRLRTFPNQVFAVRSDNHRRPLKTSQLTWAFIRRAVNVATIRTRGGHAVLTRMLRLPGDFLAPTKETGREERRDPGQAASR